VDPFHRDEEIKGTVTMSNTSSEKDRPEAPSKGSSSERSIRPFILGFYCVCLLLSAAYLYRLARWTDSSGMGWLGPSVLKTLLVMAGLVLCIQFFRALLKRRFLHILFLALIVASFVPAYLNLHRPLERFHLLEYSILGILIFWTMAPKRYSIQFYLRALNILLVVSFLDEVCQGFVSERYYDIQDIWINIFSGTIGILAFRMMDLTAPLPLHPHYRDEHVATGEPPPLIDLHIFWSDLLLLIPLIVVLGTDSLLTQSITPESVQGIWKDREQKGYTLYLEEDNRVLVDFPLCILYGYYDLSGNALDGYRVSLSWGESPKQLAPPCRQAFERDLRIRKEEKGALLLYRKDTGTLRQVSSP